MGEAGFVDLDPPDFPRELDLGLEGSLLRCFGDVERGSFSPGLWPYDLGDVERGFLGEVDGEGFAGAGGNAQPEDEAVADEGVLSSEMADLSG